MKRLKTRYILICFFLCLINQANSQIVSTFPIPDSEYHNPETSIILKSETPVMGLLNNWIVSVEGSKSGILKTKLVLSSDRKTLIIKHKSPFIYGETIHVKINHSQKNKSQNIDSEFKFHIKNGETPRKEEFPKINNAIRNSTENFPPLTVNINDNPANGKIFFYNISALASNNDRFYAIIKNDGTPFFAKQDNDKGLGFTLQKNGYITFWNDKNFLMMDSTYAIIDTFACGNGYEADWHEFQLLENGHAYLIAWDVQTVDMSAIVPGGQEFASVEGFVIQELDEDKNIVFQWRSWDHFQITDAVDIDFTTSYVSYTHGNALDVDSDGNILVSSRLMNEITKIDGTTGDIIWRLGGKNNEFTFIGDEGFCRQHDIRKLANGNITLFDNGTCHDPQISSAKEYELDETNKTATLVWEYEHPMKIYSETMGNVQRLSNGNTFINWGRLADTAMTGDNLQPAITEVKPNKSIAYELTFDTFFHMVYRSYRFEWNVAPPVSTENNVTSQFNDFKIFPVPTTNLLNIEINSKTKNKSIISIVNLSGEIVKLRNKELHPGKNVIKINTEHLAEGIYFCKITSGEYFDSKKFIVIK